MSSPIMGTIISFAGNFAPRGWMFCNGQLISISQNTALFSILGTTYGGNGTTNFALPDLRGRAPIGTGQGAGLSSIQLGEMSGSETVTLLASQLPAHTHTMPASTGAQTTNRPTGAYQAAGNSYSTATPDVATGPSNAPSGGGQPHDNRSPYLGMNYIIAVQGIYPSRN
jgi:microcystin-dependent protein